MILACESPLPGQELKCVPLSEMYLASQALAFFKLIVDTQVLTGTFKCKVQDDSEQIWKYLVSIHSNDSYCYFIYFYYFILIQSLAIYVIF